jgi:DNA polymerase alpha subunit A
VLIHVLSVVGYSEAGLLGFLCAQIHKIDPDVLIGHELHSYTLEVLLQRMHARNIMQWSKLGRLKKNK